MANEQHSNPLAAELPADASPDLLWAEIYRLRAELSGPAGYPSWAMAATAERLRRVSAERRADELAVQHASVMLRHAEGLRAYGVSPSEVAAPAPLEADQSSTEKRRSDLLVIEGAVQKARAWLAGGCTGEPPRTSIALLATFVDTVIEEPRRALLSAAPQGLDDAVDSSPLTPRGAA